MNRIRTWQTAMLSGMMVLAACQNRDVETDRAEAPTPIERVEVDVVTPDRDDRAIEAVIDTADSVFDGPSVPATLRYRGLETEFDNGNPVACFRFSSDLDADRVIEDRAFVRVDPETPFSLDVRGRSLCVLGLSDSVEQQTVSVLAGLSAANGSELSQTVVETIAFDPKPALVGFVGDGIILPRSDGAVLGVKAMNADAVELIVYRVNHRALFDHTPDVGETAPEGQWAWNSAAWSSRVEVHKDRIETPGEINEMIEVGYSLAEIVEENGPGAYIVEVKRDTEEETRRAATSWRWLYVTDLAVASYRTSEALDVTVRSIASSETVGDVKLTLIARNNEVLAEGRTDADGRARFPGAALRGTGNLAPKMLLAYAGEDDFAALDLSRSPLDLTAYDVSGRAASGPVDAFLYTERGVYRPGETVHLTALIRDRFADAAFDRDGTLSVTQPDGTVFIERRVSPGDLAGALIETIDVSRAAPRGRWTASLSLDGLDEVGQVRFAVEDFIPEQLRLDIRADEGPIELGEPRTLTVAADFLYGAAGRGLDAEAEARITVDPSPFPQWASYSFGDAAQDYREQFVSLGQGLTDEDGLYRTNIELGGEAYRSSSPLRLFVTAGVSEPGGRYVRDSLFLPLRSENVYVGFDPAFDGGYAKRNTPAAIDLIAVDATGERVSVPGTISLIREDYDYHWYRENGRWRYRRDRRDHTVDSGEIVIGADAPYVFSQALSYGEYRLQFQTEAGATFSYRFGSGWRRAGGDSDTPDRIEMGLSQAEVSPGDTVTITVNSPFSGTGELVIADREVRTVQTVRINEGQSEVRLPLGRDWTTDLYAMLTVYSPGAEEQPRRAVGLVHIPMDRSAQTLSVSIDAPERILPRTEQPVTVKVAGLDGDAAFLTLAVVDSGILQITDYDPPSPENHFFGKTAFPIDVFDDYSRMLAPFSGTDRVGGDALGGAGLSVVPTQIVSLFTGPVTVRNGEATVDLDIPDFQGELTLMSVAWSDTALGSASTRMTVRDPVTAQLALPRFLALGDEAVATVALDNVDGSDGLYTATVSRGATALGAVEQLLARGDRSEDGITVLADGSGVSTYRIAATGPDFAIERDYRIETRAPSLPETRTRFVRIDAGETVSVDLSGDRDGLIPGTIDTLLSASFTPGLDARPLLTSLQRYPYGCTEQTVSVALPLLLSDAVGSIPGFSDEDRRLSVQDAVDTLISRQSANGAFGLWRRDDGAASPYLQLYASDFILTAADAGFDVPRPVVERTLNGVRSLAQLDRNVGMSLDFDFGLNSSSPDYELRAAERAAYAMALQARHDRVKKTDLLYLERRFGDRLRGSIAQSQLGYALAAMGEAEKAQAAFARAGERMSGEDITYYDSDIRNAAALVALGDDLPDDLLTQALLTLQVDNPQYLNTHEKAWVLRALAGRRSGDAPFSSDGWTSVGATSSRSVEADQERMPIENDSSAPIWVQVTVTGQPDGPMQARSQGATLSKRLYTMDGQLVTDEAVRRGERRVIVIEACADRREDAMWVVADLLPAGFEIETILSSDDAGDTGPFDWIGGLSDLDLTEARDDRFVASWRVSDRYGDRTRRMAYVVRAVTQGDFAFPGAHMEDMYRPTRMATTPGTRLRVTAAPSL